MRLIFWILLKILFVTISYKSTLQLCGLSAHVDVAFITNQKWVSMTPQRLLCTLKGSGSGGARGFPRAL